jgi:hypothetical protein
MVFKIVAAFNPVIFRELSLEQFIVDTVITEIVPV